MSTNDIFAPKQVRSQDTQRKLIIALHVMLQEKFFEHISIKELAEHAGVSVGTFYRRFKNKESLLPLLYQDFGQDLHKWANKLEQRSFTHLKDAIEYICKDTFEFLRVRKGIYRTLHLNARLHSELLKSDPEVDRRDIYQQLSRILLRFDKEIVQEDKTKVAELIIFTLISGLMEKVLYTELTPAIASDLSPIEYMNTLPSMLFAFAQAPDA